ncbi:MAG: flagellar export chaperone FliS [Aquincola sp.]|uniref:flagellar export chaperone FliS n=1 Tax=uncultured Aquincola sp. TaxID=886556 RepID=UPI0032B25D6B|nr:flagellar export chaperone FliS [Aquincola sp.]|tara:strand:- start:719 stop:1162 length:444 start_codon:yes stop_codon:yes gene_type:complete
MYAPHAASPFGHAHSIANMYRAVGVNTSVEAADPHRLVAMLFDGFMDAIAQARGALLAGDIERKGREISRAARIVEEGLKGGLNLEAGGGLAADLNDLYAYVTLRLTQANLRNDEQALQECRRLIEPLRDAWAAIAPQATTAASTAR